MCEIYHHIPLFIKCVLSIIKFQRIWRKYYYYQILKYNTITKGIIMREYGINIPTLWPDLIYKSLIYKYNIGYDYLTWWDLNYNNLYTIKYPVIIQLK